MSGSRNFSPEVVSLVTASARNGLAPRGGLAFDGTAANRAYSTLTNQSIATDVFSVVLSFRVPTSAPSPGQSIYAIQAGNGAGGPGPTEANSAYIDTSGAFVFYLRGSGPTHYNYATISNVVTNFGGKVVTLAFVRNASGNPSVYINAVAQSPSFGFNGTPPTWQGTVTSTNFIFGGQSGEQSSLTFYSASLYNLALSQADVTEIYELGGAVPERFKFGTQQNIITASFGNSGGAGGYETFSSASAAGFTAVNSSSGGNAASTIVPAVGIGAQYRVRGSITLNSGSLPSALLYEPSWSTQIANAPVLTAGSFDLTLTATASSPTGSRLAIFTASNSDFVLSGVTLQRLGAVAHYDADLDGIGYQLHDQSTNKLDAVLTTTGVSWTKPKLTSNFFRGYTATAGNEQVALTPIVRGPARILAIYAKASGAATVTVGLFSAGVELVASIALTVGVDYQKLTIKSGAASFYNGDGVVTNTNVSIWVNSTTANRIDWYVTWEPLNP